MTGYSGTPLPRKLGITAGHRVLLVDAPDGFALSAASRRRDRVDHKSESPSYDVIVAFCPDQAALTDGFGDWRSRLDAPCGRFRP